MDQDDGREGGHYKGVLGCTTPKGLAWALKPEPGVGSPAKVHATTDANVIDGTFFEPTKPPGYNAVRESRPLMEAVKFYDQHDYGPANLQHLLNFSENLDVVAPNGKSLMHGAVWGPKTEEKCLSLIRMLFAAGVPFDIQDKDGNTPKDTAAAKSRPEGPEKTIQLLEEYSALSLKLPTLYTSKSTASRKMMQFWNAKLSMMCTDAGKRVVHTVMLVAQRLIRWDVEERRKIRTGRTDRTYPDMPRPPQQRLPALPRERWEFILSCIRRVALGTVG